jgi:hypothetical protein
MTSRRRLARFRCTGSYASTSILLALILATPVAAQSLPEIRLSERNRVPACVTPDRLMRFLTERNPDLPAKFRGIASHYKTHGERHGVRWDYAFFQMIIETNYLLFRNAKGKGDVSPSQNNFAGIGTTGGGVPGDSFPDVSTGVLGQIQHLIAYSGERVDNPVANRTREKQDHIISASQRLRRAVTFRDLAGRWAVDRRYARSIAFVADQYKEKFCTGRQPDPEPAPSREVEASVKPAPPRATTAIPPAALGEGAPRRAAGLISPPRTATRSIPCKVFTASYGGTKNVLIRRRVGEEMHFTALQVLDGREDGLAAAFIRSHAQGGEALGAFATRDDALNSAFAQCPGGVTSAPGGQG